MCGGVDAERQSAGNYKSGTGECRSEALSILNALWCWITTANDCQSGSIEQFKTPSNIDQRRWIGNLEQRLRILGIGQRDDVLVILGRPFASCLNKIRIVGFQQRRRESVTDDIAQFAA